MKTSYVGRNLEKMVSQWIKFFFTFFSFSTIGNAQWIFVSRKPLFVFMNFFFNKNIIIIILA